MTPEESRLLEKKPVKSIKLNSDLQYNGLYRRSSARFKSPVRLYFFSYFYAGFVKEENVILVKTTKTPHESNKRHKKLYNDAYYEPSHNGTFCAWIQLTEFPDAARVKKKQNQDRHLDMINKYRLRFGMPAITQKEYQNGVDSEEPVPEATPPETPRPPEVQ